MFGLTSNPLYQVYKSQVVSNIHCKKYYHKDLQQKRQNMITKHKIRFELNFKNIKDIFNNCWSAESENKFKNLCNYFMTTEI